MFSWLLIVAICTSNINLNVYATEVNQEKYESELVDKNINDNPIEEETISDNSLSANTLELSVSVNDMKQTPTVEDVTVVEEIEKTECSDLLKLEFVPITLDKDEAYIPGELAEIMEYNPSYLSQSYGLYGDKYSSYYIYNQLDDETRKLWDEMDIVCSGYMDNEASVVEGYVGPWKCKTYGRSMIEMQNMLMMFKYTHPQYYYISNQVYYNSDFEEGDEYIYLALGVYGKFQDGSTRKETTAQIASVIDSWSAEILVQETEENKIQAIHDKICNKVDYNYEVVADSYITPEEEQIYFTQSAYSVFCTNLTVCAGYTQAFTWICNALDIEVTGVTSLDHAWNKVKVNDDWYNIDCTWDDGDGIGNHDYNYYFKNDDYYDTYGLVDSHQEESQWLSYLPKCTKDSGSYYTYVGAVPTATERVEAPIITVEYKADSCEVIIRTTTEDAKLYYTLDETQPSEAASKSFIYQMPIVVKENAQVKVIGTKDDYLDSQISEFEIAFDSDTVATGKCGDNLTWQLDSTGCLMINGNGTMYDFSSNHPAPWNAYVDQIREIVITESVTGIGAEAFGACSLVEKITISESILAIGKNAFSQFTIIEARIGSVAYNYAIENGYEFENVDEDIPTVKELRVEGFLQESEEFVYSGKEITQVFEVYYGDELLKENVDYTLHYRNNVNAASFDSLEAPSVTIQLSGQYEGTKTLYFTILPKEIVEGDDMEDGDLEDDGLGDEPIIVDRKMKDVIVGANWQEQIPYSVRRLEETGGIYQQEDNLLIYEGENGPEVLEVGKDYSITYENADEVGKVTVVFKGLGRYEGSLKKTYSIIPNTNLSVQWAERDIAGTPIAYYQKNGTAPEFQLLDQDGNGLVKGEDYNIVTKNNRDLGLMKLEINGIKNYKGYHFQTEAWVFAGNIAKAVMTVSDRQYSDNAKEWMSDIEIRETNGQRLVSGRDYEKELIYSYDDMENEPIPKVGTIVEVTAIGKKNYAGSSITGTYRICEINIEDLQIVIDSKEYTGEAIKLRREDIHVYANLADRLIGKEITSDCFKIIEYEKNTNVGVASVTLQGKGEYGGTRKCYFTINKKQIKEAKVEKVEIEETNLVLGIGQMKTLTANIYPVDVPNKTIVWTSSNENIATVDKDGLVTAKAVGDVVITAISQQGEKVDTCHVKVYKAPVDTFLIPQDYKQKTDLDDTASFNRAISQLAAEGQSER